MPNSLPNAYYTDPAIAGIAKNLGAAIYGDPGARMKKDYYDASAQMNRAHAGKYDEEAIALRDRNEARPQMEGALSDLFTPPPGVDSMEHFNKNIAKIKGLRS